MSTLSKAEGGAGNWDGMFNGSVIPSGGLMVRMCLRLPRGRETSKPRRYTLAVAMKGLALVVIGALGLASCRSAKNSPQEEVGAGDNPTPSGAAVLPDPCIEFLRQVRCWLRAAGNDTADVDRAVGNARASFEGRPHAAEACERASVFRADLIASSGCAHAGGDATKLPDATPAQCPEGEHFFVRRDGHVSGCHRDCTLPADCPDGSRCASLGSAAGGPIDEQFCE